VTAIVRPNSTSTLPQGIHHITSIDYTNDDDTALVAALYGHQALIVTMAVTAPPDTMSKLISAAAKAAIPYIFPNWYGHDPANEQLCSDSFLSPMRDRICTQIRELGVSAYLLLACGFWYEFSLGGGPDRYGFDFKTRSLTLFDEGDVAINTTTWPQCGRAVAQVLSLKRLPDDENDDAPTLARFSNAPIYVSSFRLSQRDMFDSVMRVTQTSEADWTITHESAKQRWSDGHAAVLQGNWGAFTKQLYSRMFFPFQDGDQESSWVLHNDLLELPTEDLDASTAIAIRMGENGEVATSH
jgi:hypothetical protein